MKERKRNKTRDRESEVNCRKATSLIQDYIAGSLKRGISSEFEKHLRICPDCVAFLNTYRKTIEMINAFYDKRAQKQKKVALKSLSEKTYKGQA